MMETYTGLCVGGPLDGQRLTSHVKIYRVTIFKPPAKGDLMLVHEVFRYENIGGLHGEIELDFWVPMGRNAAWAFEQIFARYSAKDATNG